MKRKIGRLCMVLGAVLILCAAGLLGYNRWDAARAEKASQEVLGELEQTMQKTITEHQQENETAAPQPVLDPTQEMTTVEVEGRDYIGVLSIPAVERELPVMAQWSYAGLKIAPGRYSGTLKVILNGLGKDAAYIISRINGFTFVETNYDYYTGELHIVSEKAFSSGERSAVRCYGADDVNEGVAIMKFEDVDVSITGNSTNPTRFQHPVAGTYKKLCVENGKKYFSVASGGGTGRTLHPDNMAAGPASYGLTDTMGRMHSDAQFAGSSSVPAHVEMMGLIGMGNNPMVGATVAVAVAVEEAAK